MIYFSIRHKDYVKILFCKKKNNIFLNKDENKDVNKNK